MHAFVVLGFSMRSQKTGLGKRLRNDLLLVEWDVRPQLNQLNFCMLVSHVLFLMNIDCIVSLNQVNHCLITIHSSAVSTVCTATKTSTDSTSRLPDRLELSRPCRLDATSVFIDRLDRFQSLEWRRFYAPLWSDWGSESHDSGFAANGVILGEHSYRKSYNKRRVSNKHRGFRSLGTRLQATTPSREWQTSISGVLMALAQGESSMEA